MKVNIYRSLINCITTYDEKKIGYKNKVYGRGRGNQTKQEIGTKEKWTELYRKDVNGTITPKKVVAVAAAVDG